MSIFKLDGIIRYYDTLIRSFLDDGWHISPMTFNGSYQNTFCYTDLVKYDKCDGTNYNFMRVFMVTEYDWVSLSESFPITKISIIAKQYLTNGYDYNKDLRLRDIGSVVSSKSFYEIKHRGVYSDSLNEFIEIGKLRRSRTEVRTAIDKSTSNYQIQINSLSDKVIDSIMKRINSIKGFKRANANCITKVTVLKLDPNYYPYT